jgi:hypothetical protein
MQEAEVRGGGLAVRKQTLPFRADWCASRAKPSIDNITAMSSVR